MSSFQFLKSSFEIDPYMSGIICEERAKMAFDFYCAWFLFFEKENV